MAYGLIADELVDRIGPIAGASADRVETILRQEVAAGRVRYRPASGRFGIIAGAFPPERRSRRCASSPRSSLIRRGP